jgi:hypothetical protein
MLHNLLGKISICQYVVQGFHLHLTFRYIVHWRHDESPRYKHRNLIVSALGNPVSGTNKSECFGMLGGTLYKGKHSTV